MISQNNSEMIFIFRKIFTNLNNKYYYIFLVPEQRKNREDSVRSRNSEDLKFEIDKPFLRTIGRKY